MSHSQHEHVEWILAGWVHKKGQRNKAWKKRYLVCYSDRTLCYYKKESDAKIGRHKANGTIDLTKTQRLELVSFQDPKTKKLRKLSLPSLSKSKPNPFQPIKKTQSDPNLFTPNKKQPQQTQTKTKPFTFTQNTDLSIAALESINEQETVKPPSFSASAYLRNNPIPLGLNGWSFNETSNVISSIKPPNNYGKDLCESHKNNLQDNIAHGDMIRRSISSSATHSRNSSLSVPSLCDIHSGSSSIFNSNRSRSYSNGSSSNTSTIISDITISNSFDCNQLSVEVESELSDKNHLFEQVINNSRSGLSCNKKYSFSLIQSNRTYILSAETNNESEQWIRLLSKLVQGKLMYSGCLAVKYISQYNNNYINKKFCVLFENKLLHFYMDYTDLNCSKNSNEEIVDLRDIIWLRRCVKNEFNDIELKQCLRQKGVHTPHGNYVINPFSLNTNNNNYSLEIAINEKRLIMTTETKTIRDQWYKYICSVFEDEFIVKMYYNSSVSQSNVRDKYIALFEDMLVVFSSKNKFNRIKQMTFFNKMKLKQYLKEKHCTIISLNDNIKVRKASQSHGNFAFKIYTSNKYENRTWYFNCGNENILNQWINILENQRKVKSNCNPLRDELLTDNILDNNVAGRHNITGEYLRNIFDIDIFEPNRPKVRRRSSPLIINNCNKRKTDSTLTNKQKMVQLMRRKIIGTSSKNNQMTVYGGNGNDNNRQNINGKNGNNNGNNNENNNNSNCNNNNNNNNFNGYNNGNMNGSNNDGDDEKDNNNNNNSKSGPSVDHKQITDENTQIESFLELLGNIKHMNDNELKLQLDNFDDNIFTTVRDTLNELDSDMMRAELIKYGINTKIIKTETEINDQKTCDTQLTIPMKENSKRPKLKKKKSKSKKNGNCRNYNALNTKKMYRIAKKLTEQIMPNRIYENINNPFDFMIKSLAINKNNITYFNQYRIFNFNLHDKNTNENLYFVGTPLNPDQNRGYWCSIYDLCSENEMKIKYKIIFNKNKLPNAMQLFDASEMKCVEEIIINSINTLKNCNWHKIPIYNRTNNKRRMKLYLEKFEFTNSFETFAQTRTGIDLIPIVMFDENERFHKEYVWIIEIEAHIKIGISFKYNKKNKTVNVNGIHLDKNYIIEQHQLILLNDTCNELNNFISSITDIHIGNPDDLVNKYNALQNRVDALKKDNAILKRQFPSGRSILTNVSSQTSVDINSDISLSLSNCDTDDTSNINVSSMSNNL